MHRQNEMPFKADVLGSIIMHGGLRMLEKATVTCFDSVCSSPFRIFAPLESGQPEKGQHRKK